jgi:primosomal protein N' (replication factor Y) (superfamily II helicase)
MVRGRHRLRLLVKSPRAFDLSAYLREWLADAPAPKGGIRLEVDIDPQSFL